MQEGYDEKEIRDLLIEGSRSLKLVLQDRVIDGLLVYLFELTRWSKKMNLVGKALSVKQIVENHFLDSLTLLHCLGDGEIHMLDVGSGAGFPGLVCKTANKNLVLSIVEPRLKRVSFLRHITRTLRLDGVEILAARIEDGALFDSNVKLSHITGRAVSELSVFLRMIEGVVQPDVQVVCMKGPKWQQELGEAREVIENMSLTLVEKHHFILPFSQAERTLLVFKKR